MNPANRADSPAYRTALLGVLFALAIALSAVESALPSFLPVPGVKLGLSNVVTMYCVLTLGARQGVALAVLKALSVLLMRGGAAAVLSGSGGLLSVLVMALLARIMGEGQRYTLLSVAGAIGHNVGQLLAAGCVLRLGQVVWYYLPLLVVAGAVMGALTSLPLRAVLPCLTAYRRKRSV